MRRVVITGAGVVSPFGCTVDAFWDGLKHGRSAVRSLTIEGTEHGMAVGASVADFNPVPFVDPKQRRLMSPAVTYGIAAAELAVQDSGIDRSAIDPQRFGAFVGSRGHGTDRQDLLPAVRLASAEGGFSMYKFATEGLPRVNPMWLLKGLANNVLYFLSLKFNAQGTNNNVSLGAVGATIAIGEAFEAIRRGYIDIAISAGYDSMLDLDRMEMFGSSGLASRETDPAKASRPFDRHRSGFVPSEGAGALVIETLEGARARGAHVYAEVLGYGSTMAPLTRDHLGPSAAGFAGALGAALEGAGVRPDAIFAHGLATRASDIEESRAIAEVLGADAARTPVPAVKSMIGNSLAASGVLEAVAALAALRDGLLPPTINLTTPDPECPLDHVAGTGARELPLRTVALNNANLGGGHAAIVLGRLA